MSTGYQPDSVIFDVPDASKGQEHRRRVRSHKQKKKNLKSFCSCSVHTNEELQICTHYYIPVILRT